MYCFYGLDPRRLRARKRRYYLIQKTIKTNSFMVLSQEDIISYRNLLFYGIDPRRYYLIQKTININSFHGLVLEKFKY